MMLELELVLPCYNESKSLEAIVSRARTAAMEAGFDSKSFRIVLVENGSKDDSREKMRELEKGALGPWFRRVDVNENQGYGFGLWSGLQTTTARYVAWSHADQQCDPKDVFIALKLLKTLPPKTLVKGTRSGRNWKDIVVTRTFESFARLFLGLGVGELNAQPKVFSRELLGEIQDPPKTFAFDLYVLYRAAKAGYLIKTIPVLFPPRIHGVSNWASNFANRRKTILNMIAYMRELARKEGRL